MNSEEYTEACRTVIESLEELSEYTEGGEAELEPWESAWMFVVISSFNVMVGSPDDDDGGSDFRVDGPVY